MKYTGEYTKEISFPLGGIGTGCVGLAGNGSLVDWEIFNRPAKGGGNGYSFFAVKAIRNGKPITKVINGDLQKDFMGQYQKAQFCGYGFGPNAQTMCGFPHFSAVEFENDFPIARLKFADEGFPADVKMTAYNPFIPGDEDNSSIPAAFFEIEISNTSDEPCEYQIAFTVKNRNKASLNKIVSHGERKMLFLCDGSEEKSIESGDITIACNAENVHFQEYFYRGQWQDGINTFWNNFDSADDMPSRHYDTAGSGDQGVVTAKLFVNAGESKKVRFVLSWSYPANYNYWSEYKDENGNHITWKNYYATMFENSSFAAAYALDNWDSLYERTAKFASSLHSATLPECVCDAAASNLAVLKSPTVLRLEDGSFYGWEGVHEGSGSCEGTCQHVWNYAYAMCFLFPRLERSIRDLEFKYATAPDGRMGFRLTLPVGREMTGFRACVDGQMGAVFKTYREWKLSGDNDWLRGHWESVKKVLDYATSESNPDRWDADCDGVLEGRQHHTLDVELYGPSSWLEGMYLVALKSAAEMAEFLGDDEAKSKYSELFEKGRAWTKDNLFNGKYFTQKIDLTDKSITDRFGASDFYWNSETGEIKYQIGGGSAIDQMLGQWHADILGLGEIFDKDQVNIALDEMMKNNFKPSMRDFVNCWRVFSLNDEAGSVICVYPEGSDKPKVPIPYYAETMTGFEYSFAGLLCSSGKIDDGVKAVGAIRNRFNGKSRNPLNEFECGSNYARSMASYALVPILSGFEFDLPHKHLGFNPYKKDGFKCVWSVDGAWGDIETTDSTARLTVTEGKVTLTSFGVKFLDSVSSVKIDGVEVPFEFDGKDVKFAETTVCKTLEIAR